jgi:hypothetical protein
VLDKLKGRLLDDSTYSQFLLGTNVYWLIRSYFTLRGLPFPGEKRSPEYLRENEPAMSEHIDQFFDTLILERKLTLTRQLTEAILEPVGGAWQVGEILAFPRKARENINTLAADTFSSLLSPSQHS